MNNNILIEFIDLHSIYMPGLLNLFNNENALKAISMAKQCGINILGIDSFKLVDETVQPSMENCVDYYDEQNTYEKAYNFIKSREQTDYYYEIVFDM